MWCTGNTTGLVNFVKIESLKCWNIC